MTTEGLKKYRTEAGNCVSEIYSDAPEGFSWMVVFTFNGEVVESVFSALDESGEVW